MKAANYNDAKKALQKAHVMIENAEHDLKGGFFLATANRAYYAAYHCMVALLLTKAVVPKSHQGVRAKFFEFLVKTNIFSVEASSIITLLFDSRQEADYDLEAEIALSFAQFYFRNPVNSCNGAKCI